MIKNGIWLFVCALLIFLFFLPSFTRMQDLWQRNVQLQRQIDELKSKQLSLLEERRRLQEDPIYLEKVAREKFGIVREGEVVYRLTPEEKK